MAVRCLQCTVQQLKSRLVGTVSLPVNRQRLIYRGRVLQDEQQLTAAGAKLQRFTKCELCTCNTA